VAAHAGAAGVCKWATGHGWPHSKRGEGVLGRLVLIRIALEGRCGSGQERCGWLGCTRARVKKGQGGFGRPQLAMKEAKVGWGIKLSTGPFIVVWQRREAKTRLGKGA